MPQKRKRSLDICSSIFRYRSIFKSIN